MGKEGQNASLEGFTGRQERAGDYYKVSRVEHRSQEILQNISPLFKDIDYSRGALLEKARKAAPKDTPDDMAHLFPFLVQHIQYLHEDLPENITHPQKQEYAPDILAAFSLFSEYLHKESPYKEQLEAAFMLAEGNKNLEKGGKGTIADMKTGEGKTLVAAMTACLLALDKQQVHVATRNDYLAQRDAQEMGDIYAAMGHTVGVIKSDGTSYVYDKDAKEDGGGNLDKLRLVGRNGNTNNVYLADVVYGVGTEFGFDYLKDNLVKDKNLIRQVRGRPHLIADEADDVMIGQATTPLIITKPKLAQSPEGATVVPILTPPEEVVLKIKDRSFTFTQANKFFAEFVAGLEEGEEIKPKKHGLARLQNLIPGRQKEHAHETGDIIVQYDAQKFHLTDQGWDALEAALGFDPEKGEHIEDSKEFSTIQYYLQNALQANLFYERDRDYQLLLSQDGTHQEVTIMDLANFSGGRPLFGRRFQDDLHAAIEAKELLRDPSLPLTITSDEDTAAETTFQNYFSLYKSLAGMTGTATYFAQEFYQTYGMDVLTIPRHKELHRIDHTEDVLYLTKEGKFDAIWQDILSIRNGRPILIGLQTPRDVEDLYAHLKQKMTDYNDDPQNQEKFDLDKLHSLTAENSKAEEDIIAQAGMENMITVTCMAGRGTDIKLGGPHATKEEHDRVNELGGLYVIGEHGSPESDEQLRGRAGRQGDNGETKFISSFEDALLIRHYGKNYIENLINSRIKAYGQEKAKKVIAPQDQTVAILSKAQAIAVNLDRESRKSLIEQYDTYNLQRNEIYADRESVLKASEIAPFIGQIRHKVVENIIQNYEDELKLNPNSDHLAKFLVREIMQIVPRQAFSKEERNSMQVLLSAMILHITGRVPTQDPRKLLLPEDLHLLNTASLSGSIAAILERKYLQNKKDPATERYLYLTAVDENWHKQLLELKKLSRHAENKAKGLSTATHLTNVGAVYQQDAAASFEQMKKLMQRDILAALCA